MVKMERYTQIQPVVFPIKGVGNYIKIVADKFTLGADSVPLNWFIYDQINVMTSPPPNEGNLMDFGTIVMSNSDLQTWGADDTVAIDWVINELNLIKI